MRSIKVSDLLGIQDKGPGALVQIDCGRDRIQAIAYHPRRILDSEIDRNRHIHPPDDLLQLVFKVLPNERSEEHTSELQSLMRISYAVFCLKKNTQNHIQ